MFATFEYAAGAIYGIAGAILFTLGALWMTRLAKYSMPPRGRQVAAVLLMLAGTGVVLWVVIHFFGAR